MRGENNYMKKTKKALVTLAIAGMAMTMVPFNVFATGTIPTRLAGTTAAETAVAIADQTGWTGTAILASSETYGMVDALTSGPLAKFLNAPILLQEAGSVLNADTKAELDKLQVKTVYIASGTAVISQAVITEIEDMGIKVEQLGGYDQYETSVNIANKMIDLGATVSKVAVAYGWLPQDALSIASIASSSSQPILLTEKDSVPSKVQEFLAENNAKITSSDVIGGTAVISDTVKAKFPSATRYAGNTAYDTNVAVLKGFDSVLKYDHVFIANGETVVDALTGAPLAAKYNAGIVLTNGTVNEGTAYVSSKLSATSIVSALGGTAVVSDAVIGKVGYTPEPTPTPTPTPIPTPVTPITVTGVSVIDGADGSTPVTSPTIGQVIRANITLSNETTIGSYPVNTNAVYKWYYAESTDTVLGTTASYTVTSDNIGKTICVDVSVDGYTGTNTWTATGLVAIVSGANLSVTQQYGLALQFKINKTIDLGSTANVKISYFTKDGETLTPISNTTTHADLVKDKTWDGYLWSGTEASPVKYSKGTAGIAGFLNVIPTDTTLYTLVKNGLASGMDYTEITDWTVPATYVVKVEVTDNDGNVSEVSTVEVTVPVI